MSLRPPQTIRSDFDRDAESPLDKEIMAEKAASLAHAGRQIEKQLAALSVGRGDRETLLQAAADAVHALLVQRELCGLVRHADVIEDYAVPREVVARIGAKPNRP